MSHKKRSIWGDKSNYRGSADKDLLSDKDKELVSAHLLKYTDSCTFVAESNKIEGILRTPTEREVIEHNRFINLPEVTVNDLLQFVSVYQPDTKLRDKEGMDVYVGGYTPPKGSQHFLTWLQEILDTQDTASPFDLHVEYENLHPFTDCNGRSGRALWAWKMMQDHDSMPLGFLHHFYYQSLSAQRAK